MDTKTRTEVVPGYIEQVTWWSGRQWYTTLHAHPGKQPVEALSVEEDEDGLELVIEMPAGFQRFNVHSLASSGGLREQLLAIVARLDDEGRS